MYRIKCTDYQATYIGETGWKLKTRVSEHKRATKNGDIRNHISEHHQLTIYKIDWDCVECVTHKLPTTTDIRNLVHKLRTKTSQQLPAPYKRLIHDLKRNRQTNNRRIENNSNSNRLITTTFTFWRIDVLTFWRPITSQQNWPIRTKTRDINTIIWRWPFHLILKMTTSQVVETSVTDNNLYKDYLQPDHHAKQIKHLSLIKILQVVLSLLLSSCVSATYKTNKQTNKQTDKQN